MMRQGCQILALALGGLLAGCRGTPPLVPAPISDAGQVVTASLASAPFEATESETGTVVAATYQAPDDVPTPAEPPDPSTGPLPPPADSEPEAGPLLLPDVVASVRDAYPLLLATVIERQVASGKQLAAWGEFDLGLKVYGIAAPEGFYETYQNGFALEQPLFNGGYLYGGYKYGDGNFQPWFKERETNEGGEFASGIGLPLLKDRAIDKRRAAVFQTELARQAVEPVVRAQLIEFVRAASQVYWSWVAAGQSVEAQRELLRNAQSRVTQIQARVLAGDLEQIARINNEQLIASRETKVIEAERKLQEAAIKLSLFLRDPQGEPIVPESERLPPTFPDDGFAPEPLDAAISLAINASPQLAELDLITAQAEVDLRSAENLLLPKLDARLLASKDVGAPTSSTRDKTPFEFEAGLYGEVPWQRREARGKLEAAQAKLSQISAKRQFTVNKIAAAVRDAESALQAARGRIDRAGTNLRLARETLELGRVKFDAGDITLIELNIYEQSVTDAQLLLIAAQADYFSALANYRAALALDPTEE